MHLNAFNILGLFLPFLRIAREIAKLSLPIRGQKCNSKDRAKTRTAERGPAANPAQSGWGSAVTYSWFCKKIRILVLEGEGKRKEKDAKWNRGI